MLRLAAILPLALMLFGCQSAPAPTDPFLPFARTRIPPPGTGAGVPGGAPYYPSQGAPAFNPNEPANPPAPSPYSPPGGFNYQQGSATGASAWGSRGPGYGQTRGARPVTTGQTNTAPRETSSRVAAPSDVTVPSQIRTPAPAPRQTTADRVTTGPRRAGDVVKIIPPASPASRTAKSIALAERPKSRTASSAGSKRTARRDIMDLPPKRR